MGIIARGTAFNFGHNDAVKDDMQTISTYTYSYSSFIAILFFGIIAGSSATGKIDL